jgi:hypothetical protein
MFKMYKGAAGWFGMNVQVVRASHCSYVQESWYVQVSYVHVEVAVARCSFQSFT